MRYILESYYSDDRQVLGSDFSLFGAYASDRNAIRYMERYARAILSKQVINPYVYTCKLYQLKDRYTNGKLVYTWSKYDFIGENGDD